MQKQYLVTLDTTQSEAVTVMELTSPLPPSPVGAKFVAQYNGVREAIEPLIDTINYALLEAVRGS